MHRLLALSKHPEPTILAFHWGNYQTATDGTDLKIMHKKHSNVIHVWRNVSSKFMILIWSVCTIACIDKWASVCSKKHFFAKVCFKRCQNVKKNRTTELFRIRQFFARTNQPNPLIVRNQPDGSAEPTRRCITSTYLCNM